MMVCMKGWNEEQFSALNIESMNPEDCKLYKDFYKVEKVGETVNWKGVKSHATKLYDLRSQCKSVWKCHWHTSKIGCRVK